MATCEHEEDHSNCDHTFGICYVHGDAFWPEES